MVFGNNMRFWRSFGKPQVGNMSAQRPNMVEFVVNPMTMREKIVTMKDNKTNYDTKPPIRHNCYKSQRKHTSEYNNSKRLDKPLLNGCLYLLCYLKHLIVIQYSNTYFFLT